MAKVYKAVTLSEEIVFLSPTEVEEQCLEKHEPVEAKPVELSAQEKEELVQSGFLKGIEEGIQQTKKQFEEQATLIHELLATIPQAINDNRQSLSQEIADIVLVIAQQFFINQQNDRESITKQINHIINQLNDKQDIELSLHPKDLTLIQQGGIKINLHHCANLRVVADETLRLGGCLIKSEHGVFDAGIERQIDNLKQVLLKMKQGVSHE